VQFNRTKRQSVAQGIEIARCGTPGTSTKRVEKQFEPIKCAARGVARINQNWSLLLTQQQQAQGMVEIGICQKNACNRAVAQRSRLRLQRRRAFNLPWQIRRGVDEEPALIVRANSNAGLCLWRNLAVARRSAVRAETVPLRQSAAGRAAQNADADQSAALNQIAPA